MHRWSLRPCTVYTALNSCLIKQDLISNSSFLIPLGFVYHIRDTSTLLPKQRINNNSGLEFFLYISTELQRIVSCP